MSAFKKPFRNVRSFISQSVPYDPVAGIRPLAYLSTHNYTYPLSLGINDPIETFPACKFFLQLGCGSPLGSYDLIRHALKTISHGFHVAKEIVDRLALQDGRVNSLEPIAPC